MYKLSRVLFLEKRFLLQVVATIYTYDSLISTLGIDYTFMQWAAVKISMHLCVIYLCTAIQKQCIIHCTIRAISAGYSLMVKHAIMNIVHCTENAWIIIWFESEWIFIMYYQNPPKCDGYHFRLGRLIILIRKYGRYMI